MSADVEVALLHWPRDDDRRARLAKAMVPRLLLVADGEEPPEPRDELEDWIRLPADERDVAARLESLGARLAKAVVLDGQVLRTARGSITLSEGEAAAMVLLLPGSLVDRDRLLDVLPPAAQASPRAVGDLLYRLRRRIRPLGLDVLTSRAKGVILSARSD
jgi:hypothetical protein